MPRPVYCCPCLLGVLALLIETVRAEVPPFDNGRFAPRTANAVVLLGSCPLALMVVLVHVPSVFYLADAAEYHAVLCSPAAALRADACGFLRFVSSVFSLAVIRSELGVIL